MRERIVAGIGSGLGWGIGMRIAIGATTLIGGGMRPVAKGAVKGGLWARDQMSVLVAEARERAEDIYHEARTERAQEQALLNGGTISLEPTRRRRRTRRPVRSL